MNRFRFIVLLWFGVLLPVGTGLRADEHAALWEALRAPGHFALMRHAIAPGTGDPAQFALGDCSTQRNLSDEGRRQARKIGAQFRANGIETADIFSSQWCRCRETAALLGLGPVVELPLLNSFFRDRARGELQTQMLLSWLDDQDFGTPVVLVTHQVNITGLTNVYPRSGEVVILRLGDGSEFKVLGTIAPPQEEPQSQ